MSDSSNAKPEPELVKTIIITLDNTPGEDATVLVCDATMTRERLEKLTGRRVIDITPPGRIELKKPIVQYAKDITRRAAAKTVKNWLRAVMATRPELYRVGVICHRPHVPHVKEIGEPFQSRIVKVAHFGSGEDRASNAWYRICDLLIVLGTPRVPPEAISKHLFRLGEIEAFCRTAEWGTFRWRGKTDTGEQIVIDGRGYPHDSDWQDAHRDLVRASIVQAVGRGRGILDEGCETIVVSTDECGVALASNQALEMMADNECTLLNLLAEITEGFPNNNTIRKTFRYPADGTIPSRGKNPSVGSPELALTLGVSDRRVREILTRLEGRGLVSRIGQRSGWMLSISGKLLFSEEPNL